MIMARWRMRSALTAAALVVASATAVVMAQPAAATTYTETVGADTHTWTNYTNAGGTQGPTIPAFTSVQIACRLNGFQVADGNTWWYQIASSPWNSAYYASADPFYNNGATSGPLKGTPFVDMNVPVCGSGGGFNETTGGAANTWSNYTNAGGTQGPTIGAHVTVSIACKITGFRVADGNTWWYLVASSPWNSQFYVSADPFYNNGQTSGSLIGTPFVDSAVPTCGGSSGGGGGGGTTTYTEYAGGVAGTHSDYTNAGGTTGPNIPASQPIQISCKVQGFKVTDGNTWWYQIASAPWSYGYYVSADAFYNNGATSGSLRGTPFVDPAVPLCSSGPRPYSETAGGLAHTWSNYTNAGGTQGPSVASGQTVDVACRITGFVVADSDSWWYLIESLPWNNMYFVSADAFYNNGATSGSLVGTPFVDTAVPICSGTYYSAPTPGTAVGSASAATNHVSCIRFDPVDCASGNYFETHADISIGGRGPGLKLARTYNSLTPATAGFFGYGWSSTIDEHLVVSSQDQSVTITLDDGSQLVATSTGGGNYTVPAYADSTLHQNGDGTFTFVEHARTTFTFSSAGALLSISDTNGYRTTLNYASGALTSISDTSGRSITVALSGGRITSATDPLNRTTTYGYDSSGNLAQVFDPLGRTTTYTYDTSHRMLTRTDSNGGVSTNTYDSNGRIQTQKDPAGLTDAYAYTGDAFSTAGGTTLITDPHGVQEFQQYENGFLAQLTKAYNTPRAATWTYTYDPNTFGLLSVTDPNGHVTKHTYDSAGNELTTTDALGNVTSTTYNGLNLPLTTTTPDSETTTTSYDAAGNVLTTRDPLGHTTTYTYGDSSHPGEVTATTDADRRVVTFTHDAAGDVSSVTTSPSSGVTNTARFSYDTDGEAICVTSPSQTAAGTVCPSAAAQHVAGTSTTTYDADGEATSATDALGHISTVNYDNAGNKTQQTDPAGHVTRFGYDADNRLVSTTAGFDGPNPSTTTNSYDIAPGSGSCPSIAGAAYCTTTTDPGHGVTLDVYDAENDKIEAELPGGQTTTYAYDLAGNLTSTTDSAGRTSSLTLDADNRITSVAYSSSDTHGVTYIYDADGRRTGMTDGTGTTSTAYDADSRVTSSANGTGSTIAYAYDGAGNATSITYPGNHIVTRTFDGSGQLSAIQDWLGNTTSFTYDADGNEIGTRLPNNDNVTSTYDATDALTSRSVMAGGGTIASVSLTRNADAQTTQEVDTGALSGSVNYTYGAKGELLSANAATYGYDPNGNMTSDGAATQSYNTSNELISADNGAGVTTAYTYDAVGDRVTAAPTSGFSYAYSYDQVGRLTGLTGTPGPAPAISAVSPAQGRVLGGDAVTITGSHFTDATSVKFGATDAASFTVVSDSKITAVTPAVAGSTQDVFVTTPSGTNSAGPADQFTFVPPPAVSEVSPSAAPTAGGNSVTVTGTNFTGATEVDFGATAASNFTVVSDSEITVTAPAESAGTVDIRVLTPFGISMVVPPDNYRFAPPPTLTALSSANGGTAGGDTITITGTGFTGATAVAFGQLAASSYSVDSDTQITATTPAEAPGTVDITVTTPGGTTHTGSADRYTFRPPIPTVTGISPTSGPSTGHTPVTITGTGFTYATSVTFGSVSVTGLNVISDSTITVDSPAQTISTQDVHVSTLSGASASSNSDRFTYVKPPQPAVTAIAPTQGSTGGGTMVTITGSAFWGTTKVKFGTSPASSFTVQSATTILAVSPQHAAGTFNVTVVTPGGTSAVGTSTKYAFVKPSAPAISSVAPTSGPTAGGNLVQISGSGFSQASSVSVGGKSDPNFSVLSDGQLTVTMPAHAAGSVRIAVTTPGGTSASVAADQYTFVAPPAPAVESIAPTSGRLEGGTTVVITGTGFTGATAVTFGGKNGTNIVVDSDTEISAASPSHAAGTVRIAVTAAGGTSPAVAADKFTYTKTAAAVTPRRAKPAATSRTTAAPSTRSAVQTQTSAQPTINAAYTYNGDGLRMSETVGASTAAFTWDSTPSIPRIIYDSANYYIYGPDGAPIEQITPAGPNYFVTDDVGSTRLLLNPDGSVGATYGTSAFGAHPTHTGSLTTPIQYAGSYTDPASGLLYMVNRSYDPVTSQFTTMDPALASTGIAYAYAGDNPINGGDPAGLFGWAHFFKTAGTILAVTGVALGIAALVASGVGAPAAAAALTGLGLIGGGLGAGIDVGQTIQACNSYGPGTNASCGYAAGNLAVDAALLYPSDKYAKALTATSAAKTAGQLFYDGPGGESSRSEQAPSAASAASIPVTATQCLSPYQGSYSSASYVQPAASINHYQPASSAPLNLSSNVGQHLQGGSSYGGSNYFGNGGGTITISHGGAPNVSILLR